MPVRCEKALPFLGNEKRQILLRTHQGKEESLNERMATPSSRRQVLQIPRSPKLSVGYTIGRLKLKSAMRIHRDLVKGRGNVKGYHFGSTGYCASTVGLDEAKVRNDIRHQEATECRQEELDLDDWGNEKPLRWVHRPLWGLPRESPPPGRLMSSPPRFAGGT